MTEYINQHGWHYKVMEREGKYRARYQKPGGKTWYGSNHVIAIARETEAEAQEDLDFVAAEQEWMKVDKETSKPISIAPMEGMCCDCNQPGRYSICGDYNENKHCKFKRDDGSCWDGLRRL